MKKLDANLNDVLTKYDIKLRGQTLSKEEIKDILNYAKFKLSQRNDDTDD